MNFLRTTFREILLWILVVALFAFANWGLQHFAPEAGVIDASIFTVLLAAFMKATGILLFALLLLAVFFPTLDTFINAGSFRHAFQSLPPASKLRATALALTLLCLLTIACLL